VADQEESNPPHALASNSPSLRANYRRGRNAALRGVARTQNPYFARNNVAALDELPAGWKRVHAQMWDQGWEEGKTAIANKGGPPKNIFDALDEDPARFDYLK
jgi:hypothetical protein